MLINKINEPMKTPHTGHFFKDLLPAQYNVRCSFTQHSYQQHTLNRWVTNPPANQTKTQTNPKDVMTSPGANLR